MGFKLNGARVAVQGFGAVGKHAARFLAEKGCVLVAASDTSATIAHAEGLDFAALTAWKDAGKPLSEYPDGIKSDADAIIDVACDIWIPAVAAGCRSDG